MVRSGRKCGRSYQDAQEVIKIMSLLQSIFKEVNDFVHQIALDNFDEDITRSLSSKVAMRCAQTVGIEIFNARTNAQVIYDMTIFDLLNYCTSKTLETLLNEKVVQMVNKTMTKRADSVQVIYLEHSL